MNIFKELISNNNFITVVGFAVTILVAFITSFLTSKINQKKTTSEVFKKEGVKVQERLLEFWAGLLIFDFDTNIDNYKKRANIKKELNGQETIKLVQSESIMYSSKNTIKAIGTYQQYSYKKKSSLIKETNVIRIMQGLVVALRVTKSMKLDFTGEKVRVIDLIRIKLNDLDIKKILLTYYFLIYYYFKERIFLLISLIIGVVVWIIFI